MPENADFLRAIIDRPDDDTVRLVYADWLDDHGDPDRAEFIRVQCELPHLPDTDTRRGPLEIRERQLLAKHAAAWIAPRPPDPPGDYAGSEGVTSVFRRGFVESAWPSDAAMFKAHPIRDLFTGGHTAERFGELAERYGPRIEVLRTTDYWPQYETENARRAFGVRLLESIRSCRFPRLREIEFQPTDELLRSGCLRSLHRLVVPPTPEGIRAVLAADFPEARTLSVSGGISLPYREALADLVRSPLWGRVEHLDLSQAEHFPPEAVFALPLKSLAISGLTSARRWFASPPTRKGPEHLTIGETLDGLSFLRSTYCRHVCWLRLFNIRLHRGDFKRFEFLDHLTRLELGIADRESTERLGDLFASPRLGRLTHLGVTARLAETRDAWSALFQNTAIRRLRSLRLECCPTTAAVLDEFLAAEPFPELHTLHVSGDWNEGIDTDRLAALLRSDVLPRLTVLSVADREDRADDIRRAIAGVDRLAWVGGEFSDGGDGVRLCLKPADVYLPHHLDDLDT